MRIEDPAAARRVYVARSTRVNWFAAWHAPAVRRRSVAIGRARSSGWRCGSAWPERARGPL